MRVEFELPMSMPASPVLLAEADGFAEAGSDDEVRGRRSLPAPRPANHCGCDHCLAVTAAHSDVVPVRVRETPRIQRPGAGPARECTYQFHVDEATCPYCRARRSAELARAAGAAEPRIAAVPEQAPLPVEPAPAEHTSDVTGPGPATAERRPPAQAAHQDRPAPEAGQTIAGDLPIRPDAPAVHDCGCMAVLPGPSQSESGPAPLPRTTPAPPEQSQAQVGKTSPLSRRKQPASVVAAEALGFGSVPLLFVFGLGCLFALGALLCGPKALEELEKARQEADSDLLAEDEVRVKAAMICARLCIGVGGLALTALGVMVLFAP